MFEQVFKNLDNALHKDSGCSTELGYSEETSWVLFLKYLDDLVFLKVHVFQDGGHVLPKEYVSNLFDKWLSD